MGGGVSVRRSHYSTTGIHPDERHDSWSERGWPSIAALFRSSPIGDFSTSADDFHFGGVTLSYAFGTARLLDRTPERIAADGIDILGASLLLDGEMEGAADRREFQARAGDLLLLDFSRPVTMTMSICQSIQLAIPRPLAEAGLGLLADLHGAVVADAAAYRGHVLDLRTVLETAGEGDEPALAASLIALLAQAVRSAAPPAP